MRLAITLALALAPAAAAQVDEMTQQANQEALVERIREQLRAIDDALLDAADEYDVADNVDAARAGHEQVIRDLEELIRQARYRRSQSSSSSSDGSESPQSQPQDQPDPRQPDDRPQQSETDPSAQRQSPESERPEDAPQPADARPEERDNPGLPPQPTAPFTRSDLDGRWGLLPPKLQERLMNLHVDDVPERYRLWLEAYTRRVHELDDER